MSRSRENVGDDTAKSSPSGKLQSGRNPPLVIVSEQGRHSNESRRIVRAQAARASAAQSRVTRARNREGKEIPIDDAPHSPGTIEPSQAVELPSSPPIDEISILLERPLFQWLIHSLNKSATSLLGDAKSSVLTDPPPAGGLATLLPTGGAISSVFGSLASDGQGFEDPRRLQLPLAIPSGFLILQQRKEISDSLATLLSRTACIDFGSPGVEERLHQLLYDLAVDHARSFVSPTSPPGHPVQGYMRIACICLTIFQGQRVDGEVFSESKYQAGLNHAWSEATYLDQTALAEPKSADASLWAIFIINVTTGSTESFFHVLLHRLLQYLELRSWCGVRQILQRFIYPASILEAPCKSFFERLQELRIGAL